MYDYLLLLKDDFFGIYVYCGYGLVDFYNAMKYFFLKVYKKYKIRIMSQFLSLGKTLLRKENVRVLSVAEQE